MKEKVNQMLKDKLFLIMLVLGLPAIVVAAGVITVQRGKGTETNPCLEMPQPEIIAQEIAPETPQVIGASETVKDTQKATSVPTQAAVAKNEDQGNDLAAEAGAGKDAADVLVLNFTDASKMQWPVRGNVLLDYSMGQTIYFPTFDQYKCNPGIIIQSDVSTPMATPTDARILEIGSNEEIGNYVVMNLGNEYTATYGQLKEVCVAEGEYLKEGQTLGYVSESTKYHFVEGINVFFEMKHQDKAVDLLSYMKQIACE